MARFTILIGIGLVAVSVAVVVLTGATSFTPWIPAVLGVVLVVLGWAARKGGMGPIWGIRLVAAIGLIACAVPLVKGGFNMTSRAQQAQAVTAVFCLLLLLRSLSATPPPSGPPTLEWGRRPPH